MLGDREFGALLVDKTFDADWLVKDLTERGSKVVILSRSNSKNVFILSAVNYRHEQKSLSKRHKSHTICPPSPSLGKCGVMDKIGVKNRCSPYAARLYARSKPLNTKNAFSAAQNRSGKMAPKMANNATDVCHVTSVSAASKSQVLRTCS